MATLTDSPYVKPYWELWTDGACDNNGDRMMGIGASLLLDCVPIGGVSQFVGYGNSMIAEWRALVAGLEVALEMRAVNLQIRCDSETVVRQMQGIYGFDRSPHLLPYRDQAYAICRRLVELDCGRPKIRWAPGDSNWLADHLSRVCLSRVETRLSKKTDPNNLWKDF